MAQDHSDGDGDGQGDGDGVESLVCSASGVDRRPTMWLGAQSGRWITSTLQTHFSHISISYAHRVIFSQ